MGKKFNGNNFRWINRGKSLKQTAETKPEIILSGILTNQYCYKKKVLLYLYYYKIEKLKTLKKEKEKENPKVPD